MYYEDKWVCEYWRVNISVQKWSLCNTYSADELREMYDKDHYIVHTVLMSEERCVVSEQERGVQ